MVTVHFYAGLRDLAKLPRLELPWAPNMQVNDLRHTLYQQYPSMTPLLTRSSVAVNDQLCSDEQMIPDGADVAFLPPVSGG